VRGRAYEQQDGRHERRDLGRQLAPLSNERARVAGTLSPDRTVRCGPERARSQTALANRLHEPWFAPLNDLLDRLHRHLGKARDRPAVAAHPLCKNSWRYPMITSAACLAARAPRHATMSDARHLAAPDSFAIEQ
jgi:hypothetical protein